MKLGSGGIAGSALGAGGTAGSALGASGSSTGGLGPTLAMTSTTVPTNGAFVAANTCMGADTSPDLEWSPGTSEPLSYAVELADAGTGVVQWIVWDIPATVTSLPAGLPATPMLAMPAGAKQVSTSNSGYVGPCPPSNQQHFYEFTIFALPVATLAGVTTDSPPSAVATAINLTPPIDIAFFGASAGMAPPATGGVAGSN